MGKLKILLADLTYIHPNEFIHPLPLGIGYIGAYLMREFNNVELEIIKDPNDLFKKLPEMHNFSIIAMSNYAWNMRLNSKFLKLIRKRHPEIITVMGGPNIDADSNARLSEFFLSVPELDFYILGEGERNLYSLVKTMTENGMKPDWDRLPATILGFDQGKKVLLRGKGDNIGLCDLKDLPSPYLCGIMDKFLEDPRFAPIIETSRGCPFHCAFCCWGNTIDSKVRQFPTEKVLKEIEYITQRTRNPMRQLYFTDANFGMFERDELIAKALKELSLKTGFPKSVYVYFFKNINETVLRTAKHLNGLTSVSMSKQSFNQDVLKLIGRYNIADEKFKLLHDQLAETGGNAYCELIYGLPGETFESFLRGMEVCARAGVPPLIYPLLLLKGTKLNSDAYRSKYEIKSSFRLMFRYAGTFGDINSVEYEEVATANSMFSKKDFAKLRLVHFLLFIFTENIFDEMAKYLTEKEKSIISLILFLLAGRCDWPMFLKKIVREFERDASDELIGKEKLKNSFSSKEIADIKSRPLALNIYHFCTLVADKKCLTLFKTYLVGAVGDFFGVNSVGYDHEELSTVMNASFDKVPDFQDVETVRVKKYNYELDAWLSSAGRSLRDFYIARKVSYKLSFSKDMKALYKEQYIKHNNIGISLYWLRMNCLMNTYLAYTFVRSKVVGGR